MAAPENELQAAIWGVLVADTDLAALVGNKVYDRVPMASDVAPYVTFGPSDHVPEDAECIDGIDVSVQVDVWSEKQGGFKECKEITWAIRKALHEVEIDLPTHALAEMRVTQTRHFRDPDGITSHGVVTVEAQLEAN